MPCWCVLRSTSDNQAVEGELNENSMKGHGDSVNPKSQKSSSIQSHGEKGLDPKSQGSMSDHVGVTNVEDASPTAFPTVQSSTRGGVCSSRDSNRRPYEKGLAKWKHCKRVNHFATAEQGRCFTCRALNQPIIREPLHKHKII